MFCSYAKVALFKKLGVECCSEAFFFFLSFQKTGRQRPRIFIHSFIRGHRAFASISQAQGSSDKKILLDESCSVLYAGGEEPSSAQR